MSVREAMDPEELRRIIDAVPFPDPCEADDHGLLAYGGDLLPERLVSAYARGIFPWYEENPILWFSPNPRAVLLPGRLVVNRSLRRTLRRGRYELRVDTAFEAVIRACREAPRRGQDGTWITEDLLDAFVRLHELGLAHCFETWCEGELVGGVYGLSLGAAFFGESMFATRSDASKVALAGLLLQIERWGFAMLDCQVSNAHTASLGARDWPRDDYLRALEAALEVPTRRGRWQLDVQPGDLAALADRRDDTGRGGPLTR